MIIVSNECFLNNSEEQLLIRKCAKAGVRRKGRVNMRMKQHPKKMRRRTTTKRV